MAHDVAEFFDSPNQTSQVSEVPYDHNLFVQNVPTSNTLIPRTGNDATLTLTSSVSSRQQLVTGHGYTVRDSTTTHYSVETKL